MGGQHLVLPFQKNVQLLILHFFMATLKNILLCAKYLKDKQMFGILIFRSKELYFLFVCLFFIETLGYNTDKNPKYCLCFWHILICLYTFVGFDENCGQNSLSPCLRTDHPTDFIELQWS